MQPKAAYKWNRDGGWRGGSEIYRSETMTHRGRQTRLSTILTIPVRESPPTGRHHLLLG